MNVTTDGTPEYQIAFDPRTCLTSDTGRLEAYAFKDRQPVVLDLINVLAAVEYADRSSKRSVTRWARALHLTVPVYEQATWLRQDVHEALVEAVRFLTGDAWSIEFVQRTDSPMPAPQVPLALSPEIRFVIPYSDGVDSRAVAAIYEAESPNSLQRVRVGSVGADSRRRGQPAPFTRVPYRLNVPNRTHAETTGRSRGFKFAVIAGIAAHLGEVQTILIPESGTGIFGPALTTYMHAYPDYRNSPLFYERVSLFLEKLLGRKSSFVYPRLWNTKAETIQLASERCTGIDFTKTRSCWMKQNIASHGGNYFQCGVCAACLFRRMSFQIAGVMETSGAYLCENLGADAPGNAIPNGYAHAKSLVDYAFAGASLMADFARIAEREDTLEIQAQLLAPILDTEATEVAENLKCLIRRHGREWDSFVNSISSGSYLQDFTVGAI